MKKIIQKAKIFVFQTFINKLKRLKATLEKEPKSLKLIGRFEKLNNLLTELKVINELI